MNPRRAANSEEERGLIVDELLFKHEETSQLLNYLRATGLPLGLIVNFGSEGKLEWKRLAMTHSLRGPSPLPLAALRGEE